MITFRILLLAILVSNLAPSLLAAPTAQLKKFARATYPTLGESVPGTRSVLNIVSNLHEVREPRRLAYRRLHKENDNTGKMARSDAGVMKDISSRQVDDITIITSTVTTIPKYEHGDGKGLLHSHGEIGDVTTTTTYIEHYRHGKHRHGKHCPYSYHGRPYNGPCTCKFKFKCSGDGGDDERKDGRKQCGSPGNKSSEQPDSTTTTSSASNSTVTPDAPTGRIGTTTAAGTTTSSDVSSNTATTATTTDNATATTATTTSSGVSSEAATTATTTDNTATTTTTNATTTTDPSIPTDDPTAKQPDSATNSSVTDTTNPSPTPTED